jgi:tetratricopeptide (TPR) repeat protein
VASSVLQEYDEAIRITDRYLRVNPGHVGALHIQSFSYAKKGEFEQALQLMKKILDSAPDNVEYVFQTARLAVQARRYELVDELLSTLSANRATHPKLVGVSACADFHLGRLEEAGRKFAQAISLGYDDPDGFLEYAAYLESVGMHDSSAVIRAKSDSLLKSLEAER